MFLVPSYLSENVLRLLQELSEVTFHRADCLAFYCSVKQEQEICRMLQTKKPNYFNINVIINTIHTNLQIFIATLESLY